MKGLRSADDTSMTENRSVYRVTKANHIVGATEDWEPNKRSPKEIAIRLGNCISGLNNNMSGVLGARKSVSPLTISSRVVSCWLPNADAGSPSDIDI